MVEGKYLYCIIGGDEGRNFGPIGIGDRGDMVYTIGYKNLSCVVSNTPMTKYVLSRENLMAHERVIEKVMKDYTVLPVRYCTIATSAEEVRNLLRKRYLEFKGLLKDMDNKVELGLKAFWKDINIIFQEIIDENREIKKLKEKTSKQNYAQKLGLGKRVKSLLEEKKEKERKQIINVLKGCAVDVREGKLVGDNMIINTAFLVDRSREREFDNHIEDLENTWGERVRFKYVGPVPPFNFVNIVVKWR